MGHQAFQSTLLTQLCHPPPIRLVNLRRAHAFLPGGLSGRQLLLLVRAACALGARPSGAFLFAAEEACELQSASLNYVQQAAVAKGLAALADAQRGAVGQHGQGTLLREGQGLAGTAPVAAPVTVGGPAATNGGARPGRPGGRGAGVQAGTVPAVAAA